MELQDLILVSVDDHLIEPEDMFERHIRAAFRERAPKVVRGTDGAHHWLVEGQRAPGLGLNAVAGRPKESHVIAVVITPRVIARISMPRFDFDDDIFRLGAIVL